MKAYVVIPVYGGIVQGDDVKATISSVGADKLLAAADKYLGIKRDETGHYDSDNDAYCVEVTIHGIRNPLQRKGQKLFFATFLQRDGEFEYDQDSLLFAKNLAAATDKCREQMRHWWDSGMKPVEGEEDTYEEGVGGYRIVKLKKLVEVKSIEDIITRVGFIA